MANDKFNTDKYKYAFVDTAPGADGFFTDPIGVGTLSYDWSMLYFSVRGSGVMTVTLQFKCPIDTDWSDYDTYISSERKIIEGGEGGIKWRAGVKLGDYTSGSFTFGFDWINK